MKFCRPHKWLRLAAYMLTLLLGTAGPVWSLQQEGHTISPFPDEQSAYNKYVSDPSELNATVLAMARVKYAQAFYKQFKEDKSAETLRLALSYLESAGELAPDSLPVLKLRAAIYYDQRAITEFRTRALIALQQYVTAAPNDFAFQILHIDFLMELGIWKKSVETMETVFQIDATFAKDTIIDRMTAAYISAGWPHRGIGFLEKQLEQFPSDPGLLLAKAMLQRRVADTLGARLSIGAVLLNSKASPEQKATARALRDHWAQSEPADDSDFWPG